MIFDSKAEKKRKGERNDRSRSTFQISAATNNMSHVEEGVFPDAREVEKAVRRKFRKGIDNIKQKAQEHFNDLEELMRSLPEEVRFSSLLTVLSSPSSSHRPFSFALQYFKPSKWKATKSLSKSLLFCVVSVLAITYLPWYFLPLGWIVLGTAVTGVRVSSPLLSSALRPSPRSLVPGCPFC